GPGSAAARSVLAAASSAPLTTRGARREAGPSGPEDDGGSADGEWDVLARGVVAGHEADELVLPGLEVTLTAPGMLAALDLAGAERHPEVVQLRAQEERGLGAEHARPQDIRSALLGDGRAGDGGDRACGRVGLLRGQAALLDRERRQIAGGVDAAEVDHAAVG